MRDNFDFDMGSNTTGGLEVLIAFVLVGCIVGYMLHARYYSPTPRDMTPAQQEDYSECLASHSRKTCAEELKAIRGY